jgi:hypothetical protein
VAFENVGEKLKTWRLEKKEGWELATANHKSVTTEVSK